jgi:hypothetical protein
MSTTAGTASAAVTFSEAMLPGVRSPPDQWMCVCSTT